MQINILRVKIFFFMIISSSMPHWKGFHSACFCISSLKHAVAGSRTWWRRAFFFLFAYSIFSLRKYVRESIATLKWKLLINCIWRRVLELQGLCKAEKIWENTEFIRLTAYISRNNQKHINLEYPPRGGWNVSKPPGRFQDRGTILLTGPFCKIKEIKEIINLISYTNKRRLPLSCSFPGATQQTRTTGQRKPLRSWGRKNILFLHSFVFMKQNDCFSAFSTKINIFYSWIRA